MHRPRARKVTDTKHQCITLGRPIAKYFGYRPPQSDSSGRQASRERTTVETCVHRSDARGTRRAQPPPRIAPWRTVFSAEIRSMIDPPRVADVLVSPCVRKHTRTSATQTSLRHPPSTPILTGLYVYNGRSDESGGYGTIPNAPSLTLAVGFRNENPPSNLHQHQCLQSLHTLITMRSCM